MSKRPHKSRNQSYDVSHRIRRAMGNHAFQANMTPSLKEAFHKASELPEYLQNELAKQMLNDIEAELKWDRTLASPKSRKFLDSIAKKVLREYRQGKTIAKGWDEL